jgi:hypothetical protein
MSTKTTTKPAARKKATGKKATLKKTTKHYDEFKSFNGKQYSGMQIGRSHHWQYDAGDWKETKITPDLWEISYAVTKRRKGHAPENSGAKVGTAYQWYIMAHQKVKKLNADDYTTELTGLKFKMAHKRAGKGKWNIKVDTQRKHLIALFKEMIAQLETEPIPLEFDFEDAHYKGEAQPILATCDDGFCSELEVILNDENFGIIKHMKSGWKMDRMDIKMTRTIGQQIMAYYQKDEE